MSDAIVSSELFGALFVERSARPDGDAWHHLARKVYARDTRVSLHEAAADSGFLYEVAAQPDRVAFEYTPLDEWGNPCLDENGSPVKAVEYMVSDKNTIKRLPLYQGGMCIIPPAILGYASPKWQPIQNADFIKAFERAAEAYPVETMGVILDGKCAFFTLNVGDIEIRVNGKTDGHKGYVYAANWFEPGNAAVIGASSVRVVCQNTLGAAEAAAIWKIKISHDNMAKALLEATAAAVSKIGALKTAQARALQAMALTPIDLDTARGLIKIAFQDPKQSATLLSLDSMTGSKDRTFDPVGNKLHAIGNEIAQSEAIADYRKKKSYELATATTRIEDLRLTAEVALSNEIDNGYGLNVYSVVNAVTEAQQHRNDRTRGNVYQDTVIGDRATAYNRVMKAACKLVPELANN